MAETISIEQIHVRILTIRGRRVLLDADLADLYGVSTKQLNQQLRRNREKFPEDFVFQINELEKYEVVTTCDHLQKLKFSKVRPHAFTEHGALMIANFVRSPRANQTSIAIVRAFVRLRELLISHRDLATKLQNLEKKYDSQFKVVFDAIRQLMTPPSRPISRIGFEKPD